MFHNHFEVKVHYSKFSHVSPISGITLKNVSCEWYFDRQWNCQSGYVRLPRTFSCKVRTPSAGQESTTNIKTYTTSKSNSQGRHYLSPPASRERFITEVRELSCFCVASVFANIWSVLIVKNWGQKKAHWNGIDVVLKASKYVVSLRS